MMDIHKQKRIVTAWDMFNDDDVSTERLLALTADYCACEIDEVIEALVADGRFRKGEID